MDRRETSSRRNSADRSRSPWRSEKNYEKTLVSVEQATVSKIEETNLLDLFPDVKFKVNIKEEEAQISFYGPAYQKKRLMMKMFLELKKNNIVVPR